MRIRLSGYQGSASVHTRGLHHLASPLAAAGLALEVEEDVTARGVAAKALFADVEREDAHLCYMASGYLTVRVPSLAVLDLPLTIEDRLQAHKALDGRVGETLARDIETTTGFHVLGFWDNGVRHISNCRGPIRRVEDCSGLVIRTLDNQLYQDTLTAFGFKPVVTDVRDLVAAVANGSVDAQENPLTNMLNFRLYEYHRHLSLTGHIYGVALLLCRASWFRGLQDDVAASLEAASAAATRAQRSFAMEEDRIALERLRDLGVEVVETTDLDLEGFRRAAGPVIARAVSSIDKELAEAYFGTGRELFL